MHVSSYPFYGTLSGYLLSTVGNDDIRYVEHYIDNMNLGHLKMAWVFSIHRSLKSLPYINYKQIKIPVNNLNVNTPICPLSCYAYMYHRLL